MKTVWSIMQMLFAAAGGFCGWFFGRTDGLLYTLILFLVLDYITGIMRAVVEKKVAGRAGTRGILKKILVFLLVGLSNIFGFYLLGNGETLRNAVIFFYISNEGISILENAAAIGLPIPVKLKEILIRLREQKQNDK